MMLLPQECEEKYFPGYTVNTWGNPTQAEW